MSTYIICLNFAAEELEDDFYDLTPEDYYQLMSDKAGGNCIDNKIYLSLSLFLVLVGTGLTIFLHPSFQLQIQYWLFFFQLSAVTLLLIKSNLEQSNLRF